MDNKFACAASLPRNKKKVLISFKSSPQRRMAGTPAMNSSAAITFVFFTLPAKLCHSSTQTPVLQTDSWLKWSKVGWKSGPLCGSFPFLARIKLCTFKESRKDGKFIIPCIPVYIRTPLLFTACKNKYNLVCTTPLTHISMQSWKKSIAGLKTGVRLKSRHHKLVATQQMMMLALEGLERFPCILVWKIIISSCDAWTKPVTNNAVPSSSWSLQSERWLGKPHDEPHAPITIKSIQQKLAWRCIVMKLPLATLYFLTT